MEGILKSAPKPESERIEKPDKVTTYGMTASKPAISSEFFNYFNLNTADSGGYDQLKYIHDWAMENSSDLGHALKKVKNTEIKLGVPSGGENRISKLYNYLRMSNRLSGKKSELISELAKINEKKQSVFKEIKSNYDTRKEKIQSELDRVTQEYRTAMARYNQDASARSEAIKNEYYKQIKELEAMRDAYK